MKRILAIFAIAAVLPLFTNGFHTKENSMETLLASYDVRDEQIECVKSKVSKIIADDRNTQQWLKEVERTIVTLVEGVKKCQSMTNPKQSTCFLKLESAGLSELGRLVNIVTKEMVDTFDKVMDTVVECLLTMENSTVNSQSNQVHSNFATHDFDVTNEQIKCIANIFKIIIEHNRDLQWWFEDIGKTLLSLILDARDCATYSDSNRTICIIKLKIRVSIEVQRLAEKLPKDKQNVVAVFKSFIEGCFL